MQTRRLLCLIALISPALPVAASIEFFGISKTDKETVFALEDTAAAGSAAWIHIGQQFEDWTVTAYDDQNEALVLVRGSETQRIVLRGAKVKNGRLRFVEAGDWWRVSVEGQPSLSMDVRLGRNGEFSYPLIGTIKIGIVTQETLEKIISDGLDAFGKLHPGTRFATHGKVHVEFFGTEKPQPPSAASVPPAAPQGARQP
jgi:hypothetical protein